MAQRWHKGPGSTVIVVAVCLSIAGGIRYLLHPVLGGELPLMVFALAALASAWYGGAIPGIVALVLGLIAAECFFIRPFGTIQFPPGGGWDRLIPFLFTTGFGIFLIEMLHRARQRAEAATRKAREEVERCQRTEQQLRDAHDQIREHAGLLERSVAQRTGHLKATIHSLQSVLYHIAHDLRGPVRATHAFSSLLLRDHPAELSDQAKSYGVKIREAAARMEALMRDLLTYGQMGQMEILVGDVDLNKSVRRVLASLRDKVQSSEANIRVEPMLPMVRGDETLLDKTLFELLLNAMRFAAPDRKPEIRVRAENHEISVRLWIEDNGIGIEPRFQERIFGLFEQLRRDETGTGMGLAIVKQAMERSGGSVGVESVPGTGSRFWIELSRAPAGGINGGVNETKDPDLLDSPPVAAKETREVNPSPAVE